MRKVLGVCAGIALLATGLSGCSTTTVDDSCIVQAGKTSNLISVSGEFDKTPEVDFPTPLKAATTQRTTVIDGSGDTLAAGQRALIKMSLFNGQTGQLISQSDYTKDDAIGLTLNDQSIPGLVEGLQCTTVGSRVALAIAPADAFGPQGGNPMIGIGAKDTMVVVVDVVGADLLRANGSPRPVPNGFPHVVLAPNGQPGITVPDHDAPTELKVATRLAGHGAEVKRGDTVTIHYTGVLWDKGTVFNSTWESGAPATFLAEEESKVPSDSTVPGVAAGLADALVGAKVGSQLIVVVPPDLGYGSDGQGAVPGDATLIFVVDILGTK